MIYLAILLLLLFLSFRYDICGKERGSQGWYMIVLVIFILVAGLRWRLGVDTPNYLDQFYYKTPKLSQLTTDDLSMTKPLWILLNSVVLTCFGKFYVVQLIHATFINVLFFKYIKKHSRYIFTCLFFYFLCMYTAINMEEMKASISVVICLFANDYLMEKKWMKAYLLYLFAALFHASAYIIFLMPLLLFVRLNRVGGIILILSFFVGHFLQIVLGDYLMLFEMADESIADKAEAYGESETYGSQNRNINFFIVRIFPILLYTLFCLYAVKKNNSNRELLKLEPFVMMGLAFLMMQMSMHIFYRFVRFYSIYFVLFFSEVYVTSARNSSRLSKNVVYVRASLLFLPFLSASLYGEYHTKYICYYPYTSVIERKIDRNRELFYSEKKRSIPSINQY